MDMNKVIKTLEKNRYQVRYFTSSAEASAYLDREINQSVVGFGDSATIAHMHLYDLLSRHNTVYDPSRGKDNDEFLKIAKSCLTTDVFLTSVNAMAESGEMVNIDGTGNRIAGSLFGHQRVYFVVSTNKIEPTLEKAIWRARNIAALKNTKRYRLRTPCVVKGDHCYNCASPERICNAMTIYMKKMNDIDQVEIILMEEQLGF